MAYNKKTDWQLNDTVMPADLNRIEQGIADAAEKTELKATQIYQTALGTATAIVLSDVPLENGFSKTFIVAANNNQMATTINGKPLYKPGTTATPNLKAGRAVTVWYDASGDCFFLKASAVGTAVAGDVLAGKTFSNDDDTDIEGTIQKYPYEQPALEYWTDSNGTLCFKIPKGAYVTEGSWGEGYSSIKGYDADFVPSNFLADKNVFGLQGSIPVLGGETYPGYRAAVGAFGKPGTVHLYMDKGAYLKERTDGAFTGVPNNYPGVYADDPDFVPGNILATANIFGMQGSIPVVDADVAPTHKGALQTSVGAHSGNGLNYVYFQIPRNSYMRDIDWICAYAPDLLPQNILSGKNILGVIGTASSGVAGASGVVTSSNVAEEFVDSGGDTRYLYYVVVSGLTAKPKRIILTINSAIGTSGTSGATIYAENVPQQGYCTICSAENTIGHLYSDASYTGGRRNSNAYVNETSFRLPVAGLGLSYLWTAIY